jgi:hypothetical protein
MRTTTALLSTLALALPGVAMPHPCEVEVAQMKKDLEAIAAAVARVEALQPSDLRTQMLAGVKGKFDVELRRVTEAEARCERLVRPDAPAATAVPAAAAPPAPAAASLPAEAAAPVPAPVKVPPPAPAPAPVAAAVVAPAPVVATSPVAEPPVPVAPAAPCLAGCGKDTDCKGDRICVKGECVDPPARAGQTR